MKDRSTTRVLAMTRSKPEPTLELAVQEQLQRLSDRSVPGLERGFGCGWVARLSLGATGRANTAALDRSGQSQQMDTMPVEALDWIERWYGQRGARPGVQLFGIPTDEMLTELHRRGWVQHPGAILMTVGLAGLSGLLGASDQAEREVVAEDVEVSDVAESPLADMVNDMGRFTEITSASLPKHVVTIRRNREVVGCGLGIVDGDWIGVFAMRTVPHARRTGVANRVITELAAVGQRNGATDIWLQVEASNTGAVALYERLGFHEAHHYNYWFAPTAD